MLVVSSSVGMLYGILCNSTNLGPTVTLDSVLVVSVSGLEKGLVSTSTSGNNTDLGTDSRGHSLLSSRWETKTGSTLVLIVRYNNSECSGSAGESTTITNLCLNVTDDGSLRYRGKGENISYSEGGLLSAVNVLSSVHTLGGEHELVVPLVTVSVQELYLSNGCSATRVVEDLLNNSLDISVLLGVVNVTKLDGSLTGAGMSLENGGLTLPLCLWITRGDKNVLFQYKY